MKWGFAVGVGQTLEEVLRVSKTAYEGGIDEIWLIDFPSPQFSSVAATLIARETEIDLGVGMMIPLLYTAEQVVRMISTIKKSYNVEPDVMVGSGDPLWLSRAGLGYTSGLAAVRLVEEEVKELGILLKENGISSSVLVGAQGPKMISASQSGDGVLLNYSDPKMISWALGLLRNAPKEFVRGVFPPTAIVEEKDVFPDFVKRAAAIVALGTNNKVLERFNILNELKEAKRMLEQGGQITTDIIESISVDVLEQFALYSTPSEIGEYVKHLTIRGCDLVVFGPPLSAMPNGVQLLIEAKQECNAGK